MAYEPNIVAKKVSVENRVVYLSLADGTPHSFLAAYYPRLAGASDAALKKVKLRLRGKSLRWDKLDEDIWVGHAVIGRYPAALRTSEVAQPMATFS